MKFLKVALPMMVLGILIFSPSYAQAANAHFFGPIIDPECECDTSAPDWGCVLDTAHNVFNLIFSLSILVFVLTAAYAGLLFMSTSVNPEGKSKARSMLLNTVVGLLISLSAWLIVDFVMRLLYDQSAGFGPWNSILKDGDMRRCILPAPDAPSLGINATPTGVQTTEDPTANEPVDPNSRPSGDWAEFFGFDPGISAQAGDASDALDSLLSCMAGALIRDGQANVSPISSISDSNGGVSCYESHPTWNQCTRGGQTGCCYHTKNSCHYGGASCKDENKSYSADFGNENKASLIIAAANACGASRAALENGNHIHVTAPNRCGSNGGTCR